MRDGLSRSRYVWGHMNDVTYLNLNLGSGTR